MSPRPLVDPRTAERLARPLERKAAFPFEWSYPPPNAIRVHQSASIATPAANTQTQVLAYEVPLNFTFYFTALIRLWIGGTGTVIPGDGAILWVLDVNVPVGVTSPQGYPVQGFSDSFPYGNFSAGFYNPYPLVMPEVLKTGDTLRSKVTVNNTPSGGRMVTILDGWLVKL